jgi:RNA recognition motif-containing protein
MKTLYIGNLPYSATKTKVRELFERHGSVRAVRLMTDHITGLLRGFGFVDMEDEAAAREAMTALNGSSMDSRILRVDEARPRGGSREGPRRTQ